MPFPAPQSDTTSPATKAARCARCITEMRACWHREADLSASGNPAEAASEKARGDHLFSNLLDELNKSLQREACDYLHDPSLVEDGVSEQIVSLYEKLRDLTGTASAQGWEVPGAFWTCFKRHASNVFLRAVQRDNGKKRVLVGEPDRESGKPATIQPEQKESEFGTADGMGPFDFIADADAAQDFARLFHADLLRDLLHSIPNARHRAALMMECEGVPQAEIARRLGVSPKTVYNYITKGREAAFQWARKHYDAAGEYAHWSAKPFPDG